MVEENQQRQEKESELREKLGARIPLIEPVTKIKGIEWAVPGFGAVSYYSRVLTHCEDLDYWALAKTIGFIGYHSFYSSFLVGAIDLLLFD